MAMNWDDLKVVLAISRAGSLSKAATLLGVDQSTAGRRLTAIESELGVILFTRSKTGFTETQEGDAVVRRALEVENRIDRINDDLRESGDGPAGKVRILGNGWMLMRLTATSLPSFLSHHPKINLRLVTHRPEVQSRSDATVSLWFEAAPQPGEFAIKLGDVPYGLYAAEGVDPETLDWLSFFDEDAPRRAPVRIFERMKKKGEKLRLTATDAGLVLAAVRQGAGKALLPDCIADGTPGLARISGEAPPLVRQLHLHTHPDTVQTLRVQTVIRWLRESFETTFAGTRSHLIVRNAPRSKARRREGA